MPPCVILGPTASGKSALAVAVARAVGGEILSVDSMQVYRGLDLGTAKPTADERAAVPHHGLDLADAAEDFTVARFVDHADAVIEGAAKRGVPLILAGGTPLYYKALFDGLFDGPPADPAVRERLKTQPPDDLHRRLAEVDPAAAGRIHANDQRRLIRALEVFELTGKPISSHQSQWADGTRRHDAVWFGLAWEREPLNRRINARAKEMFAAGWVEEVRALLDRPGGLSKTAAGAAGYGEIIQHLAGRLSPDDALERTKINTRQLAKRQQGWFRRFPNLNWLPGDRPADQNAAAILDALRRTTDNGPRTSQ